MAKYINNKIKSGKLAGSVFAVRFGETIERAYNPFVNNPSTAKQVEVRAKFKLLSQLAAVLGGQIAMPRQGAVSSRNRFSKVNFGALTYQNSEADITLTAIKLTDSAVSLPGVTVTRTQSSVTVSLAQATRDVNRIVYVALVRNDANELRVYDSKVVSVAGDENNYPAYFEIIPSSGVILAYGIRDNTDAARALFGNLVAPAAETIAKIIVTRVLLESDITLTETRGGVLAPIG